MNKLFSANVEIFRYTVQVLTFFAERKNKETEKNRLIIYFFEASAIGFIPPSISNAEKQVNYNCQNRNGNRT
jgi:hypothetical protein